MLGHPMMALPQLRALCAMLGNGSPKAGAKGDVRRKPGSLGKAKGTDALRRENDMPRDAANAEGLNKAQRDKLHDEIGGEGLNYHEIREIARQIKQGLL